MRAPLVALPCLVLLTACADRALAPRPPARPSTSVGSGDMPLSSLTLAGDHEAMVAVDVGSCPDGYPFLKQHVVGIAPDANGNGYVCYSDGGDATDDVLKGDGAGTEFAGGHGNLDSKGQDISFSFAARRIKETVKGEFEFHDRSNGLRVHGSVRCLVVTVTRDKTTGAVLSRRAVIGGEVTQTTDAALKVGTMVGWRVDDNGEGNASQSADAISRPSATVDLKRFCTTKLPTPQQMTSGNVQVLE